MWPFYGKKTKIVNLYPEPRYEKVIEPFCGGAGYSIRWFDRDITLYDIDEKIVGTWEYLINASGDDIMKLPIIEKGDSLKNEKYNHLTVKEKYLIGFYLNPGSSQPKQSPGKFCSWDEKSREKLAKWVEKIKHWKVFQSSYVNIPNELATWYIDPPYQVQGKWYRYSNKYINYDDLGAWCKSRNGQVMVCENLGATWLDFQYLTELQGQKHKNTEVVSLIDNI